MKKSQRPSDPPSSARRPPPPREDALPEVRRKPGTPSLTAEQVAFFQDILHTAGMAPAVPLVDRIADLMERGAVLVIAPGSARGPAVGCICSHTGLSYQEFYELRTKGWVLDGVEQLPPFEGWWTFNGLGSGRSVVHFSVPEMLEYLGEMQRICRELRAKSREHTADASPAPGTPDA